ncbi:MAG TPA: winged helix-turn-helix domain-containing protein [Oculatellaceae cyanobacterium]
MPPSIQMVTDPKKAKAIANQTRIKILQEIATTPQSISQLARKLEISPPAVLYHIKLLQNAGFIRLSKTSTVNNNLTEKFYEVTTSSYLVVMNGIDQPRGPVPPKKQEQLLLGITPEDIAKMLQLLGLSYSAQDKAAVEGLTLKLLEKLVLDSRDVYREILNQSKLKLTTADRMKTEYAAMAAMPIALDRMLSAQDSLGDLRSVIAKLQKSSEEK